MRHELVLVTKNPPTITLELGDQEALLAPTREALAEARELDVDSQLTMQEAQDLAAEYARMADAIEAWRKHFTVPIDGAKKMVMDFVREALANLDTARALTKDKAAAFYRAEQKRVEEERRAAEETARKERERLEAEARAAAERAAHEQREADEKARAAQAAKDEEERKRLRAEADAAALRAAEEAERAAAQAATASVITAPSVTTRVPKAKGMGFRPSVTVEITDLSTFLQAVAASHHFFGFVEPALSKLKRAAEDNEQFAFPGVKVTRDVTPTSRKAAA